MDPEAFMVYFLAKAEREGLSCGLDIRPKVLSLMKEEGLRLVLGFTSAALLGLDEDLLRGAYERIKETIMEDGGLPSYEYFYIFYDENYKFFGRTLPTIIFLEGVLVSGLQ